MNFRALGRGVLGGLALAVAMSLALAVAVDRMPVSDGVLSRLLWLAMLLVSGVAGWVAGYGLESGPVWHGTLAGLTLGVLGSLVAVETSAATSPLLLTLTLSTVMGTVGGLVAAVV